MFQRIFNYYQLKHLEKHCETSGDPQQKMAAVVAKQSPLDGGTVTDNCLGCLAARALILNMRGVKINSYSRLNFSVI